MEVIAPLISVVGCLIDYVFKKATSAENLDQRIDHLDAAVKELSEVREDLQKQVDQAVVVGLTLSSQVKGWLARVDEVVAQVNMIKKDMNDENKQCMFCCHPNCLLKHKLSKRVAEELDRVIDLIGKGNLEVGLSDGLLLVPVVEIPSRPAVGLDLMLERVGHLLKDEGNVGIVGLFGMGGVGKTTLLKSINNGFLSCDHGFDVVIWAVVSRDFVVEKIQQAIWVRLGLSWDESHLRDHRALRIHNIMTRKKFLLLLDDVWEGLDLDEIGIPAPNKVNGSKVVFTTRSMEVCSDMDADCKLKVEFLNEGSSWELFQQKVGETKILNSPLILPHAKTMVRKCGGLPLALVTMGRAMANKKSEDEWRYAVEILHRTPSQVRGMQDVFNLLKFGYDSLGNDNLRLCLSYCSLFPEDYEIEKEQLIEYWAGEGFLGNGNNLHIMGQDIIGTLKVACFLESGEDASRVKLHDVVRSFVLWVVSETRFIMQASQGLTEAPSSGESWTQAERISLMDNQITELSQSPHHCPNLVTLLLHLNNGLSKFCDDFFQNMPALKVLDMSFTSIKELPPSICRLPGIRHLDLSGTKLTALPKELGLLTTLRHLNLQRNPYLRTIPREAISGLSQLRVLNFYYSYYGWEMQDDSSHELSLANLEHLTNLDSLGITVTTLSSLNNVSRSRFLRGCIHYLYITECEGLHHLPLSSYKGDGDQLRRLSINNCIDLNYLTINEAAAGETWLPNLEILALNSLPSLTTVWKNTASRACLLNLRYVNIWYCDKLKNVSWMLRLPKLEIVYIFYCKEMEEMIREEDVVEEDYLNAFPKLRIISIRDAPELRSICNKAMVFPCLKRIAVIDCPKLRKLPLKANNVSELPTVYCSKEWWGNLVWDHDSHTKATFFPYFMEA